jgi:polysaccharide export outer membrane protein
MGKVLIISDISRLKRFVWGCIVCCILSGCLSTKEIIYFQPFGSDLDEELIRVRSAYTPEIKPGDVLSITVSGLDRDDRELFNPMPSTILMQNFNASFVTLPPINGFTVNSSGEILFPQLGEVRVAGLSTQEVELKLIELLQPLVKSPMVTVHIANFIISVLGEVARPAQYIVPHNRVTLPEALALAGDMTIYGNRTNVMIIRDVEGQRQFARLNLTDRSIFRSPYYYLRAGDLIYVEPTKGKLTATDRTYQLAPIIISSLSFLLLIVNTIIK